ncbi:outer membrane protein assembly factor BamA [Desulfofustis glycolicus]|uniref:Outer membrane protein assembly factor BamA n=1 Tax=Desulfofustis glycolicus DSM 9705 TaxID=1121409 RepID=A0A1M5VF37_9BACT|nr:outer membrane protein assembly factor BamA [Desulfofustis glycolicus]SHH73867.1 Beta-barrel assembly machine subunit BamA [Desulfofustis glycolicus DSM 9705]
MFISRNTSTRPARARRVRFFPVALLFVIAVLFHLPGNAAEQNTAFLPLHIVAPQVDEGFAARLDDELAAALAANGLQMVDRSQAEQLVDYRRWPPAAEVLEAVAKQTGFVNVAAGTATVIGNRISIDIKVFDLLNPENPRYFFQEAPSVTDLSSVITDVVGQVVAYTERSRFIASIAPEGNKIIDSGAILRKISSTAGDPYDPAALREDLKSIYAMGFFDDVQIDVTDGQQGKQVIFRVVEKPTVSSITFSGLAELEEKDLQEVLTIKENSILNPTAVNATAEAIKALYRTKGFYNTEVTADITYPTPTTAAVKFVVDEGEKIFIKEITFQGNDSFDDDDLEDVLETTTKGWFSWLTDSGLLNRDILNQDTARIVAFYHNNGFLEARVGEPVVNQEGKWLHVTFVIEEGPRFKVGTVDIAGDLITDEQTLLELLSIRDEEFLSRKTLRDDIIKITDYYSEFGYAFAEVRPDINKSAGGGRVDITLNIYRGDLVYINRIIIKGNSRTRDNVIRRDIQVIEGGVFNAKELRATSQKLQRLDFFEEINVNPEPTLEPDKMNVVVDVTEKSTGQFSIGAGYSSVDDVIVMGEISENNLLGLGHRLALSANIGGSSSRYNLSWTNPRLNDTEISMGIDLFDWEREYDDYTKESIGGALRFGHPFWGKWRMYESYSYSDSTLTDVSEDASYIIRESQNVPVTSAVRVAFVRDTRDRLFGATEGSRNSIGVQYAGGPLAGDAQFTAVELESSWYVPAPFGTIFHILGSVGQVWENETDKLPVYERFYLGGINTIRGYKYGKVSPIDPETGDRIGGDRMWYVNTELVIPVFKEQGVYGVVFFDIGDSIAEDEDWTTNEVAKATGVEFRWLSPLGPFRLVWGYNLDPKNDEPETVWDFSIGGQF